MARHVDVVENDRAAKLQRRVASLALIAGDVVVENAADLDIRLLLESIVRGCSTVEKASGAIERETPFLTTAVHARRDCLFLTGAVRPMRSAGSLSELRALRRSEDVKTADQAGHLRIAQ